MSKRHDGSQGQIDHYIGVPFHREYLREIRCLGQDDQHHVPKQLL